MNQKSNKISYSIIAIMVVFFLINRLMIYEIAILLVIYFSKFNYKIIPNEKIIKTITLIVGLTSLQFLFGVFPLSVLFNLNESIKEIERAITYLLIVLIVYQLRIEIEFFCHLWRLILTIVVGVCILQYTKILDVDTFLKSFYGDSVQFYNSAHTSLDLFRGGSVFINPNVFACFLVAFLGNYLAIIGYNNENKAKRLYTIGLLFVGLILSGSRTGMLVAVSEVLLYYLYIEKKTGKNRGARLLVLILFFLSFLVIALLFSNDLSGSNLRSFQLKAGMDNSWLIKINIFIKVMSNANILNYLIGFGPFNYTSSNMLLIDFESGYFIAFYGLAGIILFISLLKNIIDFGKNNVNYISQKKRNIMFVLVMALFGFSAGIYFNLRIFSTYIILFFPMIFNSNETRVIENE